MGYLLINYDTYKQLNTMHVFKKKKQDREALYVRCPKW